MNKQEILNNYILPNNIQSKRVGIEVRHFLDKWGAINRSTKIHITREVLNENSKNNLSRLYDKLSAFKLNEKIILEAFVGVKSIMNDNK